MSKEEYERRANRTCKTCGKRLGELGVKDVRRITCSARCGHDSRMKEKVDVPCLVCGKDVTRYKHALEQFAGACCSHRCQKVWAAKQRKHISVINWERRSEKAKEQWVKDQSIRRYLSNPWRMALRSKLSSVYAYRKAHEKQVSDVWSYRIATRLGSNRGRVALRKVQAGSFNSSYSIEDALDRINRKREWFELDMWSKKIVNKLSNTIKRRRRKDETKRKSRSDTQEDRGVWTQMCIEWMED